MTIETEYSLGEELFYMYNNRVCKSEVSEITTRTYPWFSNTVKTKCKYKMSGFEAVTFDVDELFKTKEALIASLDNEKKPF